MLMPSQNDSPPSKNKALEGRGHVGLEPEACAVLPSIDNPAMFIEHIMDPVLILDRLTLKLVLSNQPARAFFDLSVMQSDVHLNDVMVDPDLQWGSVVCKLAPDAVWSARDILFAARDGTQILCHVKGFRFRSGERDLISLTVRNQRDGELAMLGQNVRKIVHDVRGVLACAQLSRERLETHDDSHVRRVSDVLDRSLSRIGQMSTQMLQLGEPMAQKLVLTRFPLGELVSDLALSLTDLATGVLITAPDLEGLVVEADQNQIYRVLLNLCRNAIKAGARVITIEGRRRDIGIEISVSDDGPGIPEHLLPTLFDRKMIYDGEGMGLGLVIVKEIIASHGGRVQLADNSEAGAQFSIFLPLA